MRPVQQRLTDEREFTRAVLAEFTLREEIDQTIETKIAAREEKAALTRLQDSVHELRRDLKQRAVEAIVDLPNPLTAKRVN